MLSPMMQHYIDMKAQNPDCLLFYRLGDFYEMFFDDAKTTARELELTLTSRDCGLDERAPMCGVPHHALESYLSRLIDKGYKVAIADQVEDPRYAKGLVKREIVRIVTPGTNILSPNLEGCANNFLMSIVCLEKCFGIAECDLSTGEFSTAEIIGLRALMDELNRISPVEIICNEAFFVSGADIATIRDRHNIMMTSLPDRDFSDEACKKIILGHFNVPTLESLGLERMPAAVSASGALLNYLLYTQKKSCAQITSISPYKPGGHMLIDSATQRNLELVRTMRENNRKGTLLWVVDHTRTAMGARLLRSCVEQPLLDITRINARLDAVEAFYDDMILRGELCEYLTPIYDLERIIGKIAFNSATPKDLLLLLQSMRMLPNIAALIANINVPLLRSISEDLDTLEDIAGLISESIADEPSSGIMEGGIIRDGFNADVDRYRNARTQGKEWLARLEREERDRTGISNLKVKYSRLSGYCFEVTKSNLSMVPDDFIRKQTLANGERFTTPKLRELEEAITGAEEKLYALEYELFCMVRKQTASHIKRVQKTAQAVARLDVIASLAECAARNNYVRPKFNDRGVIDIKDGRHPTVELMNSGELFVANDTRLDKKNRTMIITGPNMAGKSTYLRQNALIVLMAQMGSFVPAKSADICICDRVFTRVGASDDLASGQSTFMVEMTEMSNILRNATKDSLLILDEIGRGTGTFDGLSIAWAVVEYISNPKILGAKTLFATHYHELTELEGTVPGVANCCIAVKERGEGIIFLRKIIRGGSDKSYGIQVARLAGLPEAVLCRAAQLMEKISDADVVPRIKDAGSGLSTTGHSAPVRADDVDRNQMLLSDTVNEGNIIKEIEGLKLAEMTPLDALNTLYKMQAKLNNRWSL